MRSWGDTVGDHLADVTEGAVEAKVAAVQLGTPPRQEDLRHRETVDQRVPPDPLLA